MNLRVGCESISARGKRFLATSSVSENPTILFSVAAEFNFAEIMDSVVIQRCGMNARVAVACVVASKSCKARFCKHDSAGADLGGSMCSERCEIAGGATPLRKKTSVGKTRRVVNEYTCEFVAGCSQACSNASACAVQGDQSTFIAAHRQVV